MSDLKIQRAAKYDNQQPHQLRAWDYLQGCLSERELERFFILFRSKVEPVAPSKPVTLASRLWAKSDITKRVLARMDALDLTRKLAIPSKGRTSYVLALEGVGIDLKRNDDALDGWNDAIGVLSVLPNRRVLIHSLYAGTCEPGKYYTRNRLNPLGAARLQIDTIHADIWKVGKHRDQDNCLIQIGAKVLVTRDKNGDGFRTNDPTTLGHFGINFHHAKNRFNTSSIGRWSAGCVVIPRVNEHQLCMLKLKGSNAGTRGTYSLIMLDGSQL